jgi:hypothetical protein
LHIQAKASLRCIPQRQSIPRAEYWEIGCCKGTRHPVHVDRGTQRVCRVQCVCTTSA